MNEGEKEGKGQATRDWCESTRGDPFTFHEHHCPFEPAELVTVPMRTLWNVISQTSAGRSSIGWLPAEWAFAGQLRRCRC